MERTRMKTLSGSETLHPRNNYQRKRNKSEPSFPMMMMPVGAASTYLPCNEEDDEMMQPLSLSLKDNSSPVSSPESPESSSPSTWHPHQFKKTSPILTPFTIKDILGLGDDRSEEKKLKDEPGEVENEEEDKIKPTVDEDAESESHTPTTPSPQPMSMELDEPLNLSVKRENPESPLASDETNNNRLVNGSGRLFILNQTVSRDKSPTAALLPNDVIIPKVKHPKISNAGGGSVRNGTKSKGCGAINLKTGVKRKSKSACGGTNAKVIAVAVDTCSRSESETPTTPPVSMAGSLSPGVENGSSSNDAKKRKKARTTFTGKQIYELERQFEIKKYLSSSERSEMARLLNVTEVQVKIWFQNRRTKWKKVKQDNISNAEAAEHKVMATKGSKKDKSRNALKTSSSAPTSGTGTKISTSECSLSVSGSMDSSSDHSNASHLTDGNMSEGGKLSSNQEGPEDFSSDKSSVLLSHLSSSSPPQQPPPITIPRLSFLTGSTNNSLLEKE